MWLQRMQVEMLVYIPKASRTLQPPPWVLRRTELQRLLHNVLSGFGRRQKLVEDNPRAHLDVFYTPAIIKRLSCGEVVKCTLMQGRHTHVFGR